MTQDVFKITPSPDGNTAQGCIDLVQSYDDDGWYAHEYDFTRADNATRTSRRIYHSRADLVRALNDSSHRWNKWD